MATRAGSRKRAISGGAIAGLIGGMASFVWNGVANLRQGMSWPAFRVNGLPFFDPQRIMARGFEFWPDTIGTLTHLAISAVWGILFGLMFRGLSRGLTVLAGLFWGLVVWVCMFYVVLPFAGLPQVVRAMPVGAAILAHLFFGLFVGLGYLPFQRRRRPKQAAGRQTSGLRKVPST
jgi:hypothetical protein